MKDTLRHVNCKLTNKENQMLRIEKQCISAKEKMLTICNYQAWHHNASILDHNRKQNFRVGVLSARVPR